jgi:ribosome-associated translation inhibitor RaiA
MKIPLQITFHGIDHSNALEERIREKAAKLEQICERITSCRVVVEAHHKNTSSLHRKGEPFHIRISITVPGAELVAGRDPKDPHINEDVSVALRDAFDCMGRQLRDYTARSRGEVKVRAAAQ